MKTINLNGSWRFRGRNKYGTLPRDREAATEWMDATVPGTVHTDLMANGIIPDPFVGMNEKEVQWVDTQQWMYYREVHIPAALLGEDRIELVADGLDTFAVVRVNGRKVGEAANMFIAHRFNIRDVLHPGINTLEIVFDSPVIWAKALERQHGALRVALEPHRVHVRKAQYSFSWDWGPKLTTSGIWREIRIEAFSEARLLHPHVRVVSLSPRRAVVDVTVEVERVSRGPLSLTVFLAGERHAVERTVKVIGKRASLRMAIARPQLWWPNGYGEQPLYTALLSLRGVDDAPIDQARVPFALRTVRLLQQPDAEGRSFVFEINGTKIFCKGADWIPSDNFVPRIEDATYERLLTLAKDASMNMIRVWGGGFYEQEIFYDLCDRLGLMVWQDFMYACGEYPAYPAFLEEARVEAEAVVRRLRNHPCIVLWCGNNECEWLFCTENPKKTPDDMHGATIFRDILPSVCRRLDGTRPYWRSSPFGMGFPNAESSGNHHQWIVWSFWQDYKEYEKDNARFVTEFGFQAPANRKTFEEVMSQEERDPQGITMEHHNKQVEGQERLFRFQTAHYLLGTSLDDFVHRGQLVQAEALKTAAEHWRRRKFRTAGVLFWQLNDCWPVSSWAVVDSALRPKAAYFAAKKFFAPLLVSFKRTTEATEVWGTNDLLTSVRGRLTVVLQSLDGEQLWSNRKQVRLLENRSVRLMLLPNMLNEPFDPSSHYIYGQLQLSTGAIVENRFFFAEPKHLALRTPRIRTSLRQRKDGTVEMRLLSKTFVKGLRLELNGEPGAFSDNYFDMDPGIERSIYITTTILAGKLKRKIKMKWYEQSRSSK